MVKRHGGIYSSHIRNEGTEVFAAVKEAISVGRRAQIPVDIIHLKIADQSLWGRMSEIVALDRRGRREGVNVQANVYPYTRGNNDLVSIIPPWAHEGGNAALIERLKDPALRDRLKHDIRTGLPGWYNHYTAVGGDWSRMLDQRPAEPGEPGVRGPDDGPDHRGEDQGTTPGARPARRPLRLPDRRERLDRHDLRPSHRERHEPGAGAALVLDRLRRLGPGDRGPAARGHPIRGASARFRASWANTSATASCSRLEDAVRKMTSLNAAKVGLFDRGLLAPGLFADVTVFDPQSRDRSGDLPRAVPVQHGHRRMSWSTAGWCWKTAVNDRRPGPGRVAAGIGRVMSKEKKKPARERDPNDYLSLSRSEPDQLAGSSGKLETCLSHLEPVCEKGRAGGRARQPARPLAGSRSRVFETAVASGVDSCEVSRVGSFRF